MPTTASRAPTIAALLGMLALAACATQPREAHPPLAAALDARVSDLLAHHRVASVSLALIENGHVVLERAYGEQSAGVPATPATLFNLASLTKPVSAEVLLRLVSSGKLSLDEPMSAHWIDPDVAADPRHQLLTLRIALCHQTGLPNWRGHSPDGRLAFAFTPGTAFEYSGEGFSYAARFAERKLGVGFEALAQQVLFGPIGMTNTSFSSRDWMEGRLAAPLDEAGSWGWPQVESEGQWNAANNLITTASDYARFMVSVMQGDAMSSQLAAERWQPVRGRPNTVLGWNRLDGEGGPVFLHTGSNGRAGGERTLAYFDPARRHGIVILTSGAEGERLYLEIAELLEPGSRVVRYLESTGAQ